MEYYGIIEDQARNVNPSTQRQADLLAAHLEVKMFNVGSGEAILIAFPNNRAWLIEAGCNSEPGNQLLGNWLVPYLNGRGLTLEVMVLTHAHFDHAGAVETIIAHPNAPLADPLTIYRSDSRWGRSGAWLDRYWNALGGPYVDEVLTGAHDALILNPGIEDILIKDGHRDRPIPNGTVHFFAGSGEREYTSVFVQFHYNDATLLFTGDANKDYEVDLLAAHEATHFYSDVLKVTHHGSEHGTDETVLDAIRPGIAIASTAPGSGHELDPRTRRHLEGIDAQGRWASDRWAIIFETVVDGDITLWTDGSPSAPGVSDILYGVEYSAESQHRFDDGTVGVHPGLFAVQRDIRI